MSQQGCVLPNIVVQVCILLDEGGCNRGGRVISSWRADTRKMLLL